jgi:hypothetical protein
MPRPILCRAAARLALIAFMVLTFEAALVGQTGGGATLVATVKDSTESVVAGARVKVAVLAPTRETSFELARMFEIYADTKRPARFATRRAQGNGSRESGPSALIRIARGARVRRRGEPGWRKRSLGPDSGLVRSVHILMSMGLIK